MASKVIFINPWATRRKHPHREIRSRHLRCFDEKALIFKSQALDMETNSPSSYPKDVHTWDCGSPLYDAFELVSLCNRLDRGLPPIPPSPIHAGEFPSSESSDKCRIISPANICPQNGFESQQIKCECRRESHLFRWLSRLLLRMSRALASWTNDGECPIHHPRIRHANNRNFCLVTEKRMADFKVYEDGFNRKILTPNSLQETKDSDGCQMLSQCLTCSAHTGG